MESPNVDILGAIWEVVDDAEDLDDGNEGECVPEEARLKLAKGAPTRRWHKLRHEIAHAVSFESGFQDRLVSEFGVSLAVARRIEEAIAGHFVPVYCDTLERAGWLKPPPIMKGETG